jgi:murein DD-endopeptidase MepM/ murein hydrolase activator NlpD
MPMKSPYKGRFKVTQIFKEAKHKGLDLVGLDDKTIYSTVNGTVEAARWDTHPTGGMGLYIRIREDGTNRRFYFAHLSEVFVKQGQRVKVGDKIGVEGSTGNSTGSHLHYEVRIEPSNATFLDVSKISGIPNRLGEYMQKKERKIEDAAVTVGNTEVEALLIDGVTYAPVREIIEAIKKELDVTWSKAEGAGIKL